MKYFLILLILLNAGCSDVFSPPERPKIIYPDFYVSIVETKNLAPGVGGQVIVFPGLKLCTIQLKEYPRCLLHEIRHCIEGKWHGDAPNGDDCDVWPVN